MDQKKKPSKRIYTHHPNIKLDYFKAIDSKEKAYWLGCMLKAGCQDKKME
jgi:hypothetical protein